MKVKRGRKPPKWMFQVENLKENISTLTLSELSKELETTVKAVRNFCERQNIEASYRTNEDKGRMERIINIKNLKKIVKTYLKEYE